MKESKYDESDKKCCEWLDTIINSKFTTIDDKELLKDIKKQVNNPSIHPY